MFGSLQEKKNKGKGNGLVWHEKASRAADEFVITHTHSFDTDAQHDYSQGNCRTMLSIINKLE